MSVDHKERPSYSDSAASFAFRYQDGELCSITQQPRTTNIYWTWYAQNLEYTLCATFCMFSIENGPVARMNRVEEVETCEYHIS